MLPGGQDDRSAVTGIPHSWSSPKPNPGHTVTGRAPSLIPQASEARGLGLQEPLLSPPAVFPPHFPGNPGRGSSAHGPCCERSLREKVEILHVFR